MKLVLNTEEHFGKQLRKYRKLKGLSQVQLAKIMNCHNSNISHFEKGDNTFGKGSLETVFKYARALDYDSIDFKL
jgi:transcriptional regulator with XRE-family HTH domain